MILYRTSGPWGPGTGANLSANQVDNNFYDVAQRVKFLELNPPSPVQITSFNAVGNQLYISMSDGSINGPIILPAVRWFFRGLWTPSTVYSRDDVVTGPDSAVYLVMFTHTSGTTFEPGANDGAGHDFYSVLLKVPATSLPSGGGAGMVLTKNSAFNYDTVWDTNRPPPGGVQGEVLQKNSEVDGDASWNSLYLQDIADVLYASFLTHGDYLRWDASVGRWVNHVGALTQVLRESSWAPVLGDEGAFMVIANGTANTNVTIPRDDVQNFPIGTELHIHQDGTGAVRVVGEYGVNIYWHQNFSNTLLGQYATATAKKTNWYEWRLFGLLAGA